MILNKYDFIDILKMQKLQGKQPRGNYEAGLSDVVVFTAHSYSSMGSAVALCEASIHEKFFTADDVVGDERYAVDLRSLVKPGKDVESVQIARNEDKIVVQYRDILGHTMTSFTVEEYKRKFPDRMYDEYTKTNSKIEPVLKIGIDPKRMIDLMGQYLDKECVVFEFYGPAAQIRIEDRDHTRRSMLLPYRMA